MHAETSTDDIRIAVAAQLGEPPESVGDDDDLITLGLDSIRIMKLTGGWRKRGYDVNFAQFAAQPSVGAWSRILSGDADTASTAPEPGRTTDESEPFALAQMQHAFWVGRAEGQTLGSVAAHLYVEFDGSGVDPDRLERAVADLVDVHPMLRAQFLPDGTQRILPKPLHPAYSLVDLRHATDAPARLDELREEKSHQRLRVEDAEVIDVTLTLLPAGKCRLHLDLDMLAADAMSYRLLLADLAELYRGQTVPRSDYSYKQYLAGRADSSNPTRQRDEKWWQNRLADLPAAPTLPLVPEAERCDPNRTVRYHHWLPPEAKTDLMSGAHSRGVTPAMALASVFAETIGYWSADKRFLLNLPLFHRESDHPDIDRIVGDFTSSLMLDVDVTVPASIVERAHALQNTLHANGSHSAYSGLDVLRDLGRHRGEQVLAPIVYTSALNLGELFADSVSDAFGEPVWIVSQGPQVLLDAQVTEVRGGLLLNWDVRESAFPDGVVDAMFAQYTSAVDRLTHGDAGWLAEATPRLPIDQLSVRSGVNSTSGSVSGRALHEGFFAHAQSNPAAPALLSTDGTLTYRDTATRALSIAGALQSMGVRQGDSVAVQLPKGPDQIVAILGVLAAGAAYVPIGYDQPVARRAQILRTAEVAAAVCVDVAEYDGTAIPALPFSDGIAYPEPVQTPLIPDVESVAYVIFTSGSTGTPKGVDVPHRAAMNTVDACNDHVALTESDRALVISALEFDASVYDIFGLLSAGGSLVTMDDAARENPYTWVELVNRHGVTVLNCVPSMLDMLLTAGGDGLGTSLRAVLLGGDWVGADLPGRLAAQVPGCRFAGLGGATETAIHFSVCEVTDVPAHWTAVPFGTPLRNVQCRVVDPSGRDCPDWVAGELWVGGAGVALGYRKDPARTAERFVTVEGQNWYRTGDLARYWPDGSLEFLGRADHQVKIRGYRVELGEIEGALRSVPGVHLAVAAVIGKAAPQLVAAVSLESDSATATDEILAAVDTLLPRYMVPGRIELLDELPLTPNGKLDREAVHKLLRRGDDAGAYIAPRTKLESALAAIIGETIRAPRIGIDDDFFSLGGDSVLATQAIARIRDWLDVPAVVSDLFATRSVRALAARLTAQEVDPKRLEQVAAIYLDIATMDEAEVLAATK